MSAPILFIFLPGLMAVALLFVMRQIGWTTGLASTLCLVLALLAWQMPIDTTIQIGPLSFKVASAIVIFGRRFVLENADRAFLTLVYSLGFIWFFGASFARPGRLFWPFGLGMITLLVAALAVEPFLYAALLIEMAVLLSIPMLNPPGRSVGQGSLRYLILQTLAVPFILLAGWTSNAIDANPNDPLLILQGAIFFGLGFALWLAVFPFYTWVPLLTGETNPYVSGFVLSFIPGVVFFIALGFLDNYTWLRDNPNLPTVFQLVGTLMVVTGGIWAAFQNDLKRAFGYAVIFESGFAIIALGLHTTVGLEAFATALVPRFFGLVLFAFALSLFEQAGIAPTLEGVKGSVRRMPFASSALLIAYFSLGGLPLLAGFPVRQAIIEAVAGQSIPLMAWILVGSSAYWAGGFRMLAAMVNAVQSNWEIGEKWFSALLCSVGISAIVLIGLLPGVVLPGLLDLIQVYTHLK